MLVEESCELVKVQLFDVIGIGISWDIRVLAFVRTRHDQHAIWTQHAVDLGNHFRVLIVMLYGLETHNQIDRPFGKRNLIGTTFKEFEILICVLAARVLNRFFRDIHTDDPGSDSGEHG